MARIRESELKRLIKEGHLKPEDIEGIDVKKILSKGKRTNIGKRDDIGFVRSKWEANVYRYYLFLKKHGAIKDVQYEAETFEFPVKRGTTHYTPDFKIICNDGLVFYAEVKGYLDRVSKTKLNRMKKYYPGVKIEIIDAKRYKEIKDKFARLIDGWE